MESLPPSHAEFWDAHYRDDTTPWDLGRAPGELQTLLRRKPKDPSLPGKTRVLIPGCGAGHEVKAFLDAGYDVTAIDLSPTAVARTRRRVGPAFSERVINGDFFVHNFPAAPFDIVYERFFLAALSPALRIAYRDRMSQLLKYSGVLMGCFYYQNTAPDEGPPHGLAWGEADELFGRYFLLVKDVPVNDSLPGFAGRERWQERRRTSQTVPPI